MKVKAVSSPSTHVFIHRMLVDGSFVALVAMDRKANARTEKGIQQNVCEEGHINHMPQILE